jgi:hypothetical protein
VKKELGRLIWGALAPSLLLGCATPRAKIEAPSSSTVLAFEKDPRLLIEEVERIRGLTDRRPTRILLGAVPELLTENKAISIA